MVKGSMVEVSYTHWLLAWGGKVRFSWEGGSAVDCGRVQQAWY